MFCYFWCWLPTPEDFAVEQNATGDDADEAEGHDNNGVSFEAGFVVEFNAGADEEAETEEQEKNASDDHMLGL